MATIAFAAVGKFLGTAAAVSATGGIAPGVVASYAATGLKIGAYAGMLLDSFWLPDKLFSPTPIEGQKLGDLQIQATQEGAPIWRVYGQYRVPGTLIWQTPLKEIKETQSGGTKGGSGGEFITYTYRASVAILVCSHKVLRISKIWADGKLFYDEAPDLDFTSTQLSATVETVEYSDGSTKAKRLIIENADGSVDLTKFKSGKPVVVSGWTSPATANNSATPASPTGAWTVISAKRDGSDPLKTTLKIGYPDGFLEPAGGYGFVAKALGDPVRLEQELPTHKASQVADLRFYLGEDDQLPDKLIEKWEGDAIPGFRQRTYVLFDDLLLTDFGNRVPNLEFLVVESQDPTRSSVISRIVQEAGQPESAIDVSGVTGTLRGYGIRGPQPTQGSLADLYLTFDILQRFLSGVFTFYDRASAPVVTIAPADLAAAAPGEEAARPFQVVDDPELEMPRELVVKHVDPFNDYQTGARRAFDPSVQTSQVDELEVGVVLTPDEAQALASRRLFARKGARLQVVGSLPHTYKRLLTESITVAIAAQMGDDWKILLQRVEEGADHRLAWEGRTEDIATLTQDAFADETSLPAKSTDEGGSQDGPHGGAAALEAELLQIPPLREEHVELPGIYIGAATADIRFPWRGALVYLSTDLGLTWSKIATLVHEAVFAHLVSETPGSPIEPEFIDRTNTWRVQVLGGATWTPPTVDEEELLRGMNRAVVFGEVFGWATSTKVTVSTVDFYDLTVLLRGLLGTPDDAHGAADTGRVFFLQEPGVHFLQLDPAHVGKVLRLRFVPHGGQLAEGLEREFTFDGGTARPLAPLQVVEWQSAPTTYDIELRWDYRTPSLTDELERDLTWRGGEEETWEVDVYKDSVVQANLKRTFKSSARALVGPLHDGQSVPNAVLYTFAQRTTDTITTPGDKAIFRIHQVSRMVGRGRYLEYTHTV